MERSLSVATTLDHSCLRGGGEAPQWAQLPLGAHCSVLICWGEPNTSWSAKVKLQWPWPQQGGVHLHQHLIRKQEGQRQAKRLCKHVLARALIDLPCSFVLSRFEIEEISRRVALPAAGKCSPSRRPFLSSMSLPRVVSSFTSTTCANARVEGGLRGPCS